MIVFLLTFVPIPFSTVTEAPKATPPGDAVWLPTMMHELYTFWQATRMIANLKHRVHVLWMTFRLRCPNCERGRIFTGLFNMNEICPYCGVRFEREIGRIGRWDVHQPRLAELFTIPGYFLTNALFHPPLSRLRSSG